MSDNKLPIQTFARHKTNLPSTGQEIEYRPYLVKEEKKLMFAAESKNPEEIQKAIIELLDNCLLTEGIEIKKLPDIDINWLFLQARMKSAGETAEYEFLNKENCKLMKDSGGCVQKLSVNLEDIKIEKNEEHTNKIEVKENLWVELSYPNMEKIEEISKKNLSEAKSFFEMIYLCVEKIYDNENVWVAGNDITLENVKEFIDNLTSAQMSKIYKFFNTMPKLSYNTEIKCTVPGCGHSFKKEFNNIIDFFI
jgi:hypothetical protein